ncbi:retrotransposon ORF1 [Tanacetum coccineum]
MEFWPTIGEGGFNVGNTKVVSIRNPTVKLAHRCIAMTIVGRKETTHRVTEIDLYYLYYIYTPEVACKFLYWLFKYLKAVRDKNLIYGGMLVTKIARSFGLLTNELRDDLTVEEEEEAKEEAERNAGHEGVGGSADIYRNMSQGDWQVRQARWMDQQDE